MAKTIAADAPPPMPARFYDATEAARDIFMLVYLRRQGPAYARVNVAYADAIGRGTSCKKRRRWHAFLY